jgi:hypothetical protein
MVPEFMLFAFLLNVDNEKVPENLQKFCRRFLGGKKETAIFLLLLPQKKFSLG